MKPICLMLLPVFALGSRDYGGRGTDLADETAAGDCARGAGSTTDIIPRVVFEQLSPQLGQSIVVENRTGAGGTIGSAFVAKADPDGYTILVHGPRTRSRRRSIRT